MTHFLYLHSTATEPRRHAKNRDELSHKHRAGERKGSACFTEGANYTNQSWRHFDVSG